MKEEPTWGVGRGARGGGRGAQRAGRGGTRGVSGCRVQPNQNNNSQPLLPRCCARSHRLFHPGCPLVDQMPPCNRCRFESGWCRWGSGRCSPRLFTEAPHAADGTNPLFLEIRPPPIRPVIPSLVSWAQEAGPDPRPHTLRTPPGGPRPTHCVHRPGVPAPHTAYTARGSPFGDGSGLTRRIASQDRDAPGGRMGREQRGGAIAAERGHA